MQRHKDDTRYKKHCVLCGKLLLRYENYWDGHRNERGDLVERHNNNRTPNGYQCVSCDFEEKAEDMKLKAPVYTLEGSVGYPDLLAQLNIACADPEEKMKASVPISRNTAGGKTTIGYGVDKTQRSIAADSVISIAKAIKALKGW